MNTVEINEELYLELVKRNRELEQRVVRLENFLYRVLRDADKLIVDEVLK